MTAVSALSCYTGCWWLNEYSLRLHSLHSKVLVLQTSSTSAYRRRISLSQPVSILWNVEIWLCWERKRNPANKVSV